MDGVAFGRPWLRVPKDRPALELPPRKRARISDQEMCQPPSQLYLGPPEIEEASSLQVESWIDDNDDYDHDDEDYDDEFVPDELDDDEFDDELDNNSDPDRIEYNDRGSDVDINDQDVPGPERCDPQHLSLAEHTAAISLLKEKFPHRPVDYLEHAFSLYGNDTTSAVNGLLRLEGILNGTQEISDDEVDGGLGTMNSLLGGSATTRKPLIEEITAGSSDDEDGDVSSSESSDDESTSDDLTESSEDEDLHGNDADPSSDQNDETSGSSDEDDSSSDSEDSSDSAAEDGPDEISSRDVSLPQQGSSKTQKRNARRRRAKLLRSGEVQSNASSVANDSELQARKQALLGALIENVPSSDVPMVNGTEEGEAEGDAEAVATVAEESPAPRRAKVDLGAGRRMLFGALGLKAPKSKTDEERIREGLMKDVKPLRNARIVEVVENNEGADGKDAEESDAWKSKITYRAVECCHEDIVLSEPPFPFVQRWDPQQQYASMRKRKRNSQASYYDDSYYEEDSMAVEEGETEQFSGNNKKTTKKSRPDPFSGTVDAEWAEADGVERTNGDAVEDLPALPEDLNSLTPLERGDALPGMIITWKQWTLSKATQWQPLVASVTGEVLPGSEENGLQVRLAVRDWEQNEKQFDEETGQRIYDKFEAPDMDDEEEDVDDGHRVLTWEEMIEPRVLASQYRLAAN